MQSDPFPFVASIGFFALAIFLGFELITKVPATLHTPLMSGSNAISGITIVGAIICSFSKFSESFEILGVIFGVARTQMSFFLTYFPEGMLHLLGDSEV